MCQQLATERVYTISGIFTNSVDEKINFPGIFPESFPGNFPDGKFPGISRNFPEFFPENFPVGKFPDIFRKVVRSFPENFPGGQVLDIYRKFYIKRISSEDAITSLRSSCVHVMSEKRRGGVLHYVNGYRMTTDNDAYIYDGVMF